MAALRFGRGVRNGFLEFLCAAETRVLGEDPRLSTLSDALQLGITAIA